MNRKAGTGGAALVQYAALPIRRGEEGGVEVLLITSRRTRRWIIPKGWPKSGVPPHGTAAEEAFEEAGVRGDVRRRPLGTFTYDKWFGPEDTAPCRVRVYLMKVTEERKNWPERKQRRSAWYSPRKAASLVQERELREIIRSLART